MIAKNCPLRDLQSAADRTGLRLLDPQDKSRGGIRFRLQLGEYGYDPRHERPPYQRAGFRTRTDGTPTAVNAVCWHGHRDFFRELFKLCPTAVVKTGMATYNGAAHFESTFEATGDINIGSAYRPLLAREACFCGEAQP